MARGTKERANKCAMPPPAFLKELQASGLDELRLFDETLDRLIKFYQARQQLVGDEITRRLREEQEDVNGPP